MRIKLYKTVDKLLKCGNIYFEVKELKKSVYSLVLIDELVDAIDREEADEEYDARQIQIFEKEFLIVLNFIIFSPLYITYHTFVI